MPDHHLLSLNTFGNVRLFLKNNQNAGNKIRKEQTAFRKKKNLQISRDILPIALMG